MGAAAKGSSKLALLSEAVERTVSKGDTVLFAFTHNRAHAAAFELARQFRGTEALTLVATGLLEYASILVAAGAVGRLESAFAGGTYPAPSPSRVLQEAFAACEGSDPDWTNLTITLRLMAGAMGWPFVPTHSLKGSGLWHAGTRAMMVDPFTGQEVAVIPALVPDVAFIHVPVADTLGNAVIHSPDAEASWGVKAARKVVVTAERVVTPEAFRALGPRQGLCAAQVDGVVEAPFGAHPQAQFVWSAEEGVASYAEDYAFREALRALVRKPDALRAWMEDWVFGTDHAGYLARLGEERLAALRQAALSPETPAITTPDAAASPEERAAWLAMCVAEDLVMRGLAQNLFAGIGLAHLAAWAAEARCREQGVLVDLIAETGMIGFHPMEGDPYLFNRANASSSRFHANFIDTLGVLAGPRAKACLAMLAAAQIDPRGNINSSRSGDGRLIVGSGGANDLALGGARVLVVMPLKPGRFVEDLPFVTSPIRDLAGVATDMCLFERDADGCLMITGLLCDPGGEADTIAKISQICGRPFDVSETCRTYSPPTIADLGALRRFDPKRTILA